MTNPDELNALAERCEKAEGPDRKLDHHIAEALGRLPQGYRRASERYTASLDAAMTLVPEGWAYRLDGWTAFTARVFEPEKRFFSAHSKASAALALTAAALRALAAKDTHPHA